jgi:putative transposase
MEYRRLFVPGGTYFFTVVTHLRRRILCDADTIALLRRAVALEKKRHPFTIEAMVVLPDHLHALWTLPEGDADFPGRWQRIKSAFSRGCGIDDAPASSPSRARKAERAVWQRRFWEHAIRDDRDLAAHVDYIHYNPVKHGLVAAPGDWPYSSFHRHVRLGTCAADWGSAGDIVLPDGVGWE